MHTNAVHSNWSLETVHFSSMTASTCTMMPRHVLLKWKLKLWKETFCTTSKMPFCMLFYNNIARIVSLIPNYGWATFSLTSNYSHFTSIIILTQWRLQPEPKQRIYFKAWLILHPGHTTKPFKVNYNKQVFYRHTLHLDTTTDTPMWTSTHSPSHTP